MSGGRRQCGEVGTSAPLPVQRQVKPTSSHRDNRTRPRQVVDGPDVQTRSHSPYDSQRRCIHAARLIEAGAADGQVAAQSGLNVRQVRTVRQQWRLGRTGADPHSAVVGVGQALHAGRP